MIAALSDVVLFLPVVIPAVSIATPSLSVVIPTRGRAGQACRAARTALHQSHKDIEVLVVIDGDDLDAVRMLNEVEDPRLRIVRLPEAVGAPRARNAGVQAARGEWIAFLDDDDEWLPAKIEDQMRVAAGLSAPYPVIGCRLFMMDGRSTCVWPRRLPKPGEPVADYLFARSGLFSSESQFQTSILLCKRELLEKIPFQDLPRHQDWDWVLRASREPGFVLAYSENPLVVWHNEPGRNRISTSISAADWRFSLKWAGERRRELGPRAYAGFLLTVVADLARQARCLCAAPLLLVGALVHGRPSAAALLSFLGIWLMPKRLRQRMRSLAEWRSLRGRPGVKRVTQIVTQMEAGGAQRVALWLAEGLRSRSYEAEVWFLYTKRPAFEGEPHVRSFFPRPPASVFDYLRIVVRFFVAAAAERPDVLITHTHYANVIGQAAGFLQRIPRRIAVQHNPVGSMPPLARLLDRLFGSLPLYDRIVAVSRTVAGSAARYPERYRRRMHVIDNGLPTARSAAGSSGEAGDHRNSIRQALGIPIDAAVMINVGRLAPQKNQAFLIGLLPLLPNVHLILVGEGECRAALTGAARELREGERVHFTGEVSYGMVQDCLGAGDVFVFPSAVEGLGLAVIEAMRAGLPVVAHDIPAMREVLADSGTLLPLDRGQWANALLQILLDPVLRRKQSEASKAQSERFSVERMIDEYESLFG